jgi:hydroxyethylthiazole kinase
MEEEANLLDEEKKSAQAAWHTLSRLRSARPLVHCVTNLVAMDLTANLLLAAGASPVMAHAKEEVEEIAAAASALCVNIGTLDEPTRESMYLAAKAALESGTPWLLDPVGVGASAYRRETVERLARLQPSAIRGNASEIAALGTGGKDSGGQGVDSTLESWDALDAAQELARKSGSVVAVTGSIDYVTNGHSLVAVANGHEMMGRVTAVGCALSALTAACLAVTEDALDACVHALVILGVAGEIAAERAPAAPGSYRTALIDAVYQLDEATLLEAARIG